MSGRKHQGGGGVGVCFLSCHVCEGLRSTTTDIFTHLISSCLSSSSLFFLSSGQPASLSSLVLLPILRWLPQTPDLPQHVCAPQDARGNRLARVGGGDSGGSQTANNRLNPPTPTRHRFLREPARKSALTAGDAIV